MTGSSKPWTGTPKSGDNTYILSGVYANVGNVPAGNLTLWDQAGAPTSLTMWYGGFAPGLAINTRDVTGGGIDLNLSATPVPGTRTAIPSADSTAFGFRSYGTIDDALGTLRLNTGAGAVSNSGNMFSEPGGNTEFDVNVATGSNFWNLNAMGALGDSTPATLSSNFNVTLQAGTSFINYGTYKATGAHTQVGVISAAVIGPDQTASTPFRGSFINDGLVQSSAGGAIFLTAPVTGTGQMQTNGGLIKLSAPVDTGQTINITKGTLEFGSPGTIDNPAMQFLGQISGLTAASTMLIDGDAGTSDIFKVISTAGAGSGELQVFNPGGMMADLHLIGHYQQSDFSVAGHIGASLGSNWTSISFANNPLTAFNPHS
jgi:hypothetical protein